MPDNNTYDIDSAQQVQKRQRYHSFMDDVRIALIIYVEKQCVPVGQVCEDRDIQDEQGGHDDLCIVINELRQEVTGPTNTHEDTDCHADPGDRLERAPRVYEHARREQECAQACAKETGFGTLLWRILAVAHKSSCQVVIHDAMARIKTHV